eukprot:s1141_g19.t1
MSRTEGMSWIRIVNMEKRMERGRCPKHVKSSSRSSVSCPQCGCVLHLTDWHAGCRGYRPCCSEVGVGTPLPLHQFLFSDKSATVTNEASDDAARGEDSQQVRSIASIIQRPAPPWDGPCGRGGASTKVLGPMAQQVRFAGRKLGLKRKRKNSRTRPEALERSQELRYENSRRHVIYDHRMKKWMVMWYRNGMQVFRWFTAKGSRFESGGWVARTRAILFYKQLQLGGKLGTPKPDQCRSGVRGVFFDKQEKSWVARWSNCGMKTYAMFNTEEIGGPRG